MVIVTSILIIIIVIVSIIITIFISSVVITEKFVTIIAVIDSITIISVIIKTIITTIIITIQYFVCTLISQPVLPSLTFISVDLFSSSLSYDNVNVLFIVNDNAVYFLSCFMNQPSVSYRDAIFCLTLSEPWFLGLWCHNLVP